MFQLSEVAPRLALARDQWEDEWRVERAEERKRARAEMALVDKRLRADRLLADRELQALRAGSTGDRKYVGQRYRKLRAARAKRERLG